MEPRDEYVEIDYVRIATDTGYDGASLVVVNKDGTRLWIPNSLIADHDDETGKMLVKDWFAKKEGLT